MSARVALIMLAVVAVVAVLAWLLIGTEPAVQQQQILPTVELPTPTPAPEQRLVLLFIGTDGLLHPELRSVPLPSEVHARIRVVMEELLAGPQTSPGLAPVTPYPAELNAVFVDDNAHAFVDLTAPPEPLQGSNIEILFIYGVVDSVLLNCPEVSAVQVLFGGREASTLTGHLDLSKPLVLNKRFIAAS